LEEIVDKLESAEVDLDESLKLYEERKKTAKDCDDKVKKAEAKIVKLKEENDGTFTEENY
jgi:exodeoxyribonuclease VII small subunit